MAASPSNSGVLTNVGDVVVLERNPADDCVGVQAYGNGQGVELLFEGVLGTGFVPLKATAAGGTLPAEPDGGFLYLLEALGVSIVQARLGAIESGSLTVALFSGKAETMKQVPSGKDKSEPKPVKVPSAPAAPAVPGYKPYESGGKFYALDNMTGTSSEAFKTAKERDDWIAAQASAPKPAHHAAHKTGSGGSPSEHEKKK